MLNPARADFLTSFIERAERQTGRRTLVPVWREIVIDTNTAVTAYIRIAEPPFGFLLESVVGGETWARYTFLGTEPRAAWRILPGGFVQRWKRAEGWSAAEPLQDPLAELDRELTSVHLQYAPGLPRFVG